MPDIRVGDRVLFVKSLIKEGWDVAKTGEKGTVLGFSFPALTETSSVSGYCSGSFPVIVKLDGIEDPQDFAEEELLIIEE